MGYPSSVAQIPANNLLFFKISNATINIADLHGLVIWIGTPLEKAFPYLLENLHFHIGDKIEILIHYVTT